MCWNRNNLRRFIQMIIIQIFWFQCRYTVYYTSIHSYTWMLTSMNIASDRDCLVSTLQFFKSLLVFSTCIVKRLYVTTLFLRRLGEHSIPSFTAILTFPSVNLKWSDSQSLVILYSIHKSYKNYKNLKSMSSALPCGHL